MRRHELIGRLARPADTRMVLVVLDGVGDLATEAQPRTALEAAALPNLDALAARSSLGRIVPVATGVTPGSGPGHLALFGYDPTAPETDIGRGVLEALGLGLHPGPDDVAVRGNFATADGEGRITDRRAGRIPTSECRRLCEKLDAALAGFEGPRIRVVPGEAHRFVLLLAGDDLSAAIADTDPQQTGRPPLPPRALKGAAEATAAAVGRALARIEEALADEPRANRVLLRGFSKPPRLPQLGDVYRARFGAFAGYPLYRGVAAACGMEVVPCGGKRFADALAAAREAWERFDFFFLHVKQTDQAGEDGDLEAKARALEEVDRDLPALLELGPDVVAVTGDHSTPAPMKAHSWHPVPLLLWSRTCYVDAAREFTEAAAATGHLGTFLAEDLLGLMLANAGRLAKFGA